MNDILGSIDEAKLKKAIEMVKQAIGSEEAEKLERAFADRNTPNSAITSKLGANEMAMIKAVIENPDMLHRLLSTPRGREALKHFNK